MTMEEHRKTLTKLQFKFVEEYLKDASDGGEAYMKAAPNVTNKRSASVQASKLLAMDKVQDALKDMAKSYLGVLEARIMQNVEFWLNIRDDKEARSSDRMKASEYLGKYMQMFIEKKEISGNVAVQIVDDI